MAAKKRKFAADIEPTFRTIQGMCASLKKLWLPLPTRNLFREIENNYLFFLIDILIHIKPRLSETKRSAWPSLIPDLNKLAALAEDIAQQRPRTNKDWLLEADTLDREGAWLLSINKATALRRMQGSIFGTHLVLSEMEQTMTVEKWSPHVSHIPRIFANRRVLLSYCPCFSFATPTVAEKCVSQLFA